MSPIQSPIKLKSSLPYWGILCCALLVTASEVCMKKGADISLNLNNIWDLLEIQTLFSGWIWAGIFFYILSFVFWLKILQILPLNIAFNLVNIEHIFVPVASYLFLGEVITSMRAVGIGIVLLGVWVIADAYRRVEDRI